jgi:steroid delta-isomerase-like uncharacterized protein
VKSDRHRELARRWFLEVWNERRSDTIEELAHPQCAGHHEGQESRGPRDIEAMRAQLVHLMPDLHVVIEEIIAEGDNAVVRWRFEGTHCGEMPGVPATGRRCGFAGITWLKFRHGQVVEGWDRWNQAAFIQQLKAA